MRQQGARGEVERTEVSDSIESNEREDLNPHGFKPKDVVGQEIGIGVLYHKNDDGNNSKWGFREWRFEGEEDCPIEEVRYVPDNEHLPQEVIDKLQYVTESGGAKYAVGTFNGETIVTATETWGPDGEEMIYRTGEGWVE